MLADLGWGKEDASVGGLQTASVSVCGGWFPVRAGLSLSKLCERHTGHGAEGAGEGALVVEAAGQRDAGDGLIRLAQQSRGGGDAEPADVLDHATSEIAMGTKLGIDATRKLAGEGFKRPWPPLIKMDEATQKKIDQLLRG